MSENAHKETTRLGCPKRPELATLLDAALRRGVTEKELRAQRRSWVAGEAAMGGDADEAAYRAAHDRGDKEEMARLEGEGEKRRQRTLKRMREMGL